LALLSPSYPCTQNRACTVFADSINAKWKMSNWNTHLAGLARGSMRWDVTEKHTLMAGMPLDCSLTLGALRKRMARSGGSRIRVCRPGAAGSLPRGASNTFTWCRFPGRSVKEHPQGLETVLVFKAST